MEVKITTKYYFTYIRLAKILQSNNITTRSMHCWLNKDWPDLCEEHFGTLWKTCSSKVPAVLLLGINPGETLAEMHQETSAKMFMAPLFVKAKLIT